MRLSLQDPQYIAVHAEASAPTPLKLQQVCRYQRAAVCLPILRAGASITLSVEWMAAVLMTFRCMQRSQLVLRAPDYSL